MKKYIYLFILFPLFGSAQLMVPLQQNLNTKNGLVLEYDFSNTNSYAGSGTTVNNLIGFNVPATLNNSPIHFLDPGYIQFKAASSQSLTFGDMKNYYAPVTASTRTGVFTISIWFNPTALNGVVLNDLNSTTIAGGYHTTDIEMVNGYLKFSVWPRNTILTTSGTVALNTWHHVVLVYTGTKVLAYLDGAIVGNATYNRDGPHMSSLTASQYFNFAGYDNVTNMGSGAYGSFLLSNAKFYSSALSAEEISNLYVKEAPNYDLVFMVDAGNATSYPGSGTSWYDISGAAKTGANAAGVAYNAAASGSMYYNGGATSYTNFSFNLNGASTITVELWAYPTVLNGGMFFGFDRYDVWTYNGALGFNSGNGDLFGVNASQVTSLGLLNNWKHYVFVMNAGSYLANKIYINGVSQILSQINATELTANVHFNNGVGRIACWTNSTGYMQPMYTSYYKIYDRELTQAEITNKFNKTKARHGL